MLLDPVDIYYHYGRRTSKLPTSVVLTFSCSPRTHLRTKPKRSRTTAGARALKSYPSTPNSFINPQEGLHDLVILFINSNDWL